ncbi:MAG TPA: DNA methyltransferase [Ktedonosporobacter sp.]|nr:DNA methyltransferase [Ktedonosporobacter sp.]
MKTSLTSEQVTKYFYDRFRQERARFLAHIHHITTSVEHEHYASLLLDRLIFTYFLQKKGFLNDDRHYLSNRLCHMQQHLGYNTFYRHFLQPLFHKGLAAPERSPELTALLGIVPYLDSHLFAERDIERRYPTAHIPDVAFQQLFAFFETFVWLLDSQPSYDEYSITPDILGYIFEQYSNQQQTGAYYTKEDVTAYIAKNTIIPYLFDAVAQTCPAAFQAGGVIWLLLSTTPDRYMYQPVRCPFPLPGETPQEFDSRYTYYTALRARLLAGEIHCIDDLITYNLDIQQFAQDTIRAIQQPDLLQAFYQQLQQLTVLDPTCGSGAFLFAALNVLVPLYEACLGQMRMIANTGKSSNSFLAPLTELQQYPNHHYFILKTIITNNLYGVDIMEEAAEICKLRLFLKLVAQVEHIEDVEPLSHISYHIDTGNALIGFTTWPHPWDKIRPLFHKHPTSSPPASSASSPSGNTVPSNNTTGAPFINSHQNQICTALDRALARTYGISPADTLTLQNWQSSHQPFHWCARFSEIYERGGFSVILGNPPYVEYSPRHFSYTILHFTTLSCANLYAYVIERSYHLLSPGGRQGMILPLAAFATKNMTPLIEAFLTWFPCSWLSFYHFRPSMLFCGSKVASIPTTIFLARQSGSEKRFSTHLTKWSTEHRDFLFSCLTYCQVTVPRDPENRHYYPKIGHALENSILAKILQHQQVCNYLTPLPNQNSMFYRTAGGLYWKVFLNFPWPYQTTSNKQCHFQKHYERDVFVALFNSSFFWWYYTVTFDTFNLKDYMIFGFRFTYPEDQATISALQALCQQLMSDFRRNAQHLKRGKTDSYTVYARKSKAIIDDIDRVLARHYGFTPEELDFIIQYDIKYRVTSDALPASQKKGQHNSEITVEPQ